MNERIGREMARNYLPTAFPNGYYEFEPEEIQQLNAELRRNLAAVNAQERVYDREATAFHDGSSPLREEPVMIHSWKGILHGEVAVDLASTQRTYDALGLKIIIRGTGEIQESVHRVLADLEPDSDSTEDCKVYSVGCKSVGTEAW